MLARIGDVTAHNPDVVHVLGGTNDIGTDDRAASAIQSDLAAIYAACIAAGAHVVAGTIPPSDFMDSTSKTDTLQAVNAWIESQAGANVTVVDYNAAMASDVDGIVLDGTLSGDGVHPNEAGKQALADALSPALDGLA